MGLQAIPTSLVSAIRVNHMALAPWNEFIGTNGRRTFQGRHLCYKRSSHVCKLRFADVPFIGKAVQGKMSREGLRLRNMCLNRCLIKLTTIHLPLGTPIVTYNGIENVHFENQVFASKNSLTEEKCSKPCYQDDCHSTQYVVMTIRFQVDAIYQNLLGIYYKKLMTSIETLLKFTLPGLVIYLASVCAF